MAVHYTRKSLHIGTAECARYYAVLSLPVDQTHVGAFEDVWDTTWPARMFWPERCDNSLLFTDVPVVYLDNIKLPGHVRMQAVIVSQLQPLQSWPSGPLALFLYICYQGLTTNPFSSASRLSSPNLCKLQAHLQAQAPSPKLNGRRAGAGTFLEKRNIHGCIHAN